MSFLVRTSPVDTLLELEQAAAEQYVDALALAVETRFAGAIYLLGYVFEMFVKTAYYRFVGLGAHDNVASVLKGMPAKAKTLGFAWQGNLHNVESVANLLVLERQLLGQSMDVGVEALLVGHARSLSQFQWSETLRYKRTAATESELMDVPGSVDWLQGNHAALWS